jgi:hypothetical protein
MKETSAWVLIGPTVYISEGFFFIEGTANLQSTPSGAISKCEGRRNDRRE